MPDNAPAPDGKPNPTSPSTTGAGPGRASLPPTTLKFKKSMAGKVVVMLSSVAKAPPPRTTQALTGTPAPVSTPPAAPTPAKPTVAPTLPTIKITTPPLPEAHVELRKAGPKPAAPKRTAPIKINILPTAPSVAEESIFATTVLPPAPAAAKESISAKTPPAPAAAKEPISEKAPTKPAPAAEKDSIFEIDDTPPVTDESVPVGWKSLEPGELQAFTGDLQSLDVFSNTQAKREASPTRDPLPPLAPLPVATPTPAPVAPTPEPVTKPVVEAKAPPTPPPLPKVRPLVHLPPVTPYTPVTALQPAVVLVTPAPVAKKEGVRPPPLPPPQPLGSTEPLVKPVGSPEPKEPTHALHVAPPMVDKAAATPEAKLQPPHLSSPDFKTEKLPVVVAKSPPLSEPAAVRHAPAVKTEPPHQTEPPSGRKLPPPLPPRESAKPASAVTGPILTKETKPATAPEKSRRAMTLPSKKVILARPAAPVAEVKTETKSSAVTGPIVAKENKPGTEEIKPTPAQTPLPNKVETTEVKAPVVEAKTVTKPVTVPGPTSGKETKPALRPPALPSKMIREQEIKKVAEAIPPADKKDETGVTAKASPNDPAAKAPEPEKPKLPVEPSDKPSAGVTAVPPIAEPVTDKPSGPKKHRLPVKINRPKPQEPSPDSALVATPAPVVTPAPVAVAAGVAMAAAAAVGLDQTKTVELVKPKAPPAKPPLATTRAARARRKKIIAIASFYCLFAMVLFGLYKLGNYYSHETRIEGQIIPPSGMLLGDEAWIVGDFHDMISTVTEDLAADRTPKLQDIQERQNHVQRAQSDIAAREERIRLLAGQIQALKDDITLTVKQARDASQQVWDGPGADIDGEYADRQEQLRKLIEDRAKSLGLNYQPDPTYNSPEVWANAYRLALYDVPKNVDGTKEHLWLEDQMKQWRAFTKSLDDRKMQLRDQAMAIKQAPAQKVADLQAKIDDLQHRIDGTVSEEEPIKAELQQAQDDLNQSETAEAGLDDKYYKELYALPESSITKRLPIEPNGRFSWRHVEKDSAFAEGEQVHNYWLFTRAIRPDGRQYWALYPISVGKDSTLVINIEPSAFVSTKAMLRPDLSPDEQQQ